MAGNNSKKEALKNIHRFIAGQPPVLSTAEKYLVGFDGLMDRWTKDLADYISCGGSLIRILSAPIGCGKTHLANALQSKAARMGFLVCQIDAQAQISDDDLSLYSAFCDGLTPPDALFQQNVERNLTAILFACVKKQPNIHLQPALRNLQIPIPTLKDSILAILEMMNRFVWSGYQMTTSDKKAFAILSTLISGKSVQGSRAFARLKREYDHPLLKKLTRIPGKRDARLWLESLLKMIQPLGFQGVLLILDEHDSIGTKILDRHIVQLRRMLDKLTEGHLPGVFIIYFVLDTFQDRVENSHQALDQRIKPILTNHVPNRLLSKLEDIRDLDPTPFLLEIGKRMYSLLESGPMPSELMLPCTKFAEESCRLGCTDTRQFVKNFAGLLLETID